MRFPITSGLLREQCEPQMTPFTWSAQASQPVSSITKCQKLPAGIHHRNCRLRWFIVAEFTTDLEWYLDQRCNWFSLTHHTHARMHTLWRRRRRRRRPGSWRPTSEVRETLMTQSNNGKIKTHDWWELTHPQEGTFKVLVQSIYAACVYSHVYLNSSDLLPAAEPYPLQKTHGSHNAGIHTAQYRHTKTATAYTLRLLQGWKTQEDFKKETLH